MKEIFTIGHSTRAFDEFIDILRHYRIGVLIDVRHFPKSRHNPQFNMDNLKERLPDKIRYRWLGKELGGFRKGGYEQFTCTKTFRSGIEKLERLALKKRTALMCAEILWFRCHRRYISDVLKRKKWKVWHIYDINRIEKHLIGKRRKIRCDRS